MRIPSGTTDQYIYFVAVDATDLKTRETGFSSFTVYRSRNGAAAAAMTTPTINETDSSNMPGVYELLLDEDMTIDAGDDSQEMAFHITHAGMAPVTRVIELYRRPVTAGRTLDVNATGEAGLDLDNTSGTIDAAQLGGDCITAAKIAAGAIDNATFAADVGSTAYATNIIALAVRKVLDELNLDHLLKVADSDDVVDDTVIAKLAAKGGTADWSAFDNTTDSQQAIADKVIAASPQAHAAGSSTDTTGTIDSGTYADTATINSTYWQISPAGAAVGGFGLNVQLHFDIGTGLDRIPESVNITGYFDAIAVRDVEVWAYNYNTTTWDQLSNSSTHMDGSETSSQNYQYTNLTADHVQTSDGEVLIRFTATSTTTGDDLYLDYVSVGSVAVEAAGLTADAIQTAVWARADSGHDEDTLGYNVSKLHLKNGDIVSATDATRFVIDFNIPANDIYNGMVITVEDKTDDHYESRRIVDTIAASDEVILDRALGFTPVAGDDYYIMNAAYADVNLDTIKTQAITCAAGVTVGVYVGGTAAASTHTAAQVYTAFGTGGNLTTCATAAGFNTVVPLSAAKNLAYIQLLARSDAFIATDNATELAEINANGGSGAGDYANTADALEVLSAITEGVSTDISNLNNFNPANDTVATVTAVGVCGSVSTKTGYALANTGADLVLKTSTFALAMADALCDELLVGHTTADTVGLLLNEWQDGGRLDLILDAILAMLDDARAEPGQGAPAVNPDAMTKLDYLYKAWRNKATQTATEYDLYNDAGAVVDQKATVGDDGTTLTRGELGTGP